MSHMLFKKCPQNTYANDQKTDKFISNLNLTSRDRVANPKLNAYLQAPFALTNYTPRNKIQILFHPSAEIPLYNYVY
jgi:hypothetical protein